MIPVIYVKSRIILCSIRLLVLADSPPAASGIVVQTLTEKRYDHTTCYFNVRSKADMSQLNRGPYRTETTTKNCKTEKLKSKNGYVWSKHLVKLLRCVKPYAFL